MSWALIIFDCDGVLVDSEPIANRVLAELLTEAGIPTSTEVLNGRRPSEFDDRHGERIGRHDETGRNRTRVPGIRRAGCERATFQTSAVVAPNKCHPPGD